MIKTQGVVRDENFRPIDGRYSFSLMNILIIGFSLGIVLLGEPVQWERSLQVITDLLLTDGNPGVIPTDSNDDRDHIPIIACNKDLVFKAAADLPRFGHGAFLTCLEALYKVNNTSNVNKKFYKNVSF